MRRFAFIFSALLLAMICLGLAQAQAAVWSFDFETGWTTDYAPGWQNSLYRHGDPPIGKMMQQVSGGYNSANAMKLIADSVPQDWMWWAIVEPIVVDELAMRKEYNPYLKAMWYDEGTEGVAGQIYTCPSWVNPYIPPGEDWTDVQFGGRFNHADNYYYVAAGENSPGWVDTQVARTGGWHELKMQLLNSDGYIHFYVDGAEVGTSYRNDYVDLLGVSLATMFLDPLSDWTEKPYTIWDDYEFGSDYVPEPATILVWGLLGLVAAGYGLWRRRR